MRCISELFGPVAFRLTHILSNCKHTDNGCIGNIMNYNSLRIFFSYCNGLNIQSGKELGIMGYVRVINSGTRYDDI